MASTTTESDGVFLQAQPAATYGPFRFMGGTYGVSVGSAGTAQLQKLAADGSTSNVNGTAYASNTYNVVQLSPGLYNILVGTAATDVGVSKINARV
jgi:hypothetical protein